MCPLRRWRDGAARTAHAPHAQAAPPLRRRLDLAQSDSAMSSALRLLLVLPCDIASAASFGSDREYRDTERERLWPSWWLLRDGLVGPHPRRRPREGPMPGSGRRRRLTVVLLRRQRREQRWHRSRQRTYRAPPRHRLRPVKPQQLLTPHPPHRRRGHRPETVTPTGSTQSPESHAPRLPTASLPSPGLRRNGIWRARRRG